MDSRSCVVDGQIPAYFHELVSIDQEYLKINLCLPEKHICSFEKMFAEQHIIPAGCELIKVAKMYAVIEHLDGSIECITPVERIRFTDNK